MKTSLRYILVLLWVTCSCSTYAGTVNVLPGKGKTISEAIKKATAGDTLFINTGLYKESDINVNKRLFIIGKGNPVIDGQKKSEIFVISADSAVITGLTVQNTGTSSMSDMAAIRIQKADYVIISDNKLLNNTYGVYIQNSARSIVRDNFIKTNTDKEYNSGNGVHVWRGEGLLILNNKIYGHRDGIYLEFVIKSKVVGNTSVNNKRYGLHFMFSHNDEYRNNLFSKNGSGVAVMFSNHVEMYGNTFQDNWGDASYGLLLKEITDGVIEHNIFTKNTVGIYMEGATRIHTQKNLFKDNGWAMRIQASSSQGSFVGNNFISNTFDVATNGTMVMNVFKQNYWDKYDGYDLDKNNVGDIAYYPVSLYAVITEKVPTSMILYHSFLTDIMDKVEKVMPSIIPDQLKDDEPMMKKCILK